MQTSIFLAKLIGPVMAVMGLYVVLYPDRIARAAREILDSDALLLIAGALALPSGLAIVITHDVWALDWRGAITLIGWIMIGAGGARMLLPIQMKALGDVMLRHRAFTLIPGLLMVLLGLYLSSFGYLVTPSA